MIILLDTRESTWERLWKVSVRKEKAKSEFSYITVRPSKNTNLQGSRFWYLWKYFSVMCVCFVQTDLAIEDEKYPVTKSIKFVSVHADWDENIACKPYPGKKNMKSCFHFLDFLITKRSFQTWLYIAHRGYIPTFTSNLNRSETNPWTHFCGTTGCFQQEMGKRQKCLSQGTGTESWQKEGNTEMGQLWSWKRANCSAERCWSLCELPLTSLGYGCAGKYAIRIFILWPMNHNLTWNSTLCTKWLWHPEATAIQRTKQLLSPQAGTVLKNITLHRKQR